MEKSFEIKRDYYKVLVTIQVRPSMSIEVEADIYTKAELALQDAIYITETQGLKARIVHEVKTTYYFKHIESKEEAEE